MASQLPNAIHKLITAFAWNKSFTHRGLQVQLDCCIDVQTHVPPWFLEDVIYCFPPKKQPPTDENLWTLKFYNPLSFGAPFRPFDIRLERLNRRSCFWLFMAIKREYLKRKRMHRKPLHRLLDQTLDVAWPRLLERLGDLTLDDIEPIGYMASCITHSMLLHFPLAGPLSHWRPLFDSFWPHGLPSS